MLKSNGYEHIIQNGHMPSTFVAASGERLGTGVVEKEGATGLEFADEGGKKAAEIELNDCNIFWSQPPFLWLPH
jgi:hypothetical protein